jgi:hypothetical protein
MARTIFGGQQAREPWPEQLPLQGWFQVERLAKIDAWSMGYL